MLMAREGMQICPQCGGKGSIRKPKIKVDGKGKSKTEMTEETCPRCHWVGWIPR